MIPTHRPTNLVRSVVSRRGDDLTYTDASASYTYAGEAEDESPTESVTYTTFVSAPNNQMIATEFGDRFDADMVGVIAVPETVTSLTTWLDISHGYETTFDGHTYQVEEISAEPRETDPTVAVISFTRKTSQ